LAPDFTLSIPAEAKTAATDIVLEAPAAQEAKEEVQAKPDIVLETPAVEPAKTDVALEGAAPAGNLIDFNFELPGEGADKPKAEAVKEAETPPAAEQAAPPVLDFDLGGEKAAEVAAEPAPAKAAAAPAAAVEPDIKLDLGAAPAAPAVEPDFKLDLDGIEAAVTAAAPGAGAAPAAAPAPAAAAPAEAAAPAVPEIKLDHIDLSFDEAPKAEAPKRDEGPKDDRWYDVQTKFDLAKAYQEMGDKDGAREILEEVIKEGDPGQQAEAKEMLAALA